MGGWPGSPWWRAGGERWGSIATLPLLAALGAAMASRQGTVVFVLLGSAIGLTLVGRLNRGVFVGVLVVAILNGIPGIDFQRFVSHGHFRPSDVLVLFLFAALLHWAREAPARLPSWLVWWSVALVGWWFLTLVRTVLLDGVPFLQAALFCRDFLYFALAVPLFFAGLYRKRDLIGLLVTFLATALMFATAQMVVQLAHVHANWILHPTLVTEFEGVQRVYSSVSETVFLSLPLGVGLAILGTNPRYRFVGLLIAAVCGVAVTLQLTRAIYIGLFLGLIVVSAIWFAGRDMRFSRFRRTAATALLTLLALVLFSALSGVAIVPHSFASVVAARIQLGINDLANKSGNVGVRYQIYGTLWHLIGNRWPIGLGFWHPAAKPVPGLPLFSIRNGDVGLMNAVATMGVIGTALLYVPPLVVLRRLLRTAAAAGESSWGWVRYGAAVWVIAVIVSSPTLVTLFSLEGLMFSAVAIALLLRIVSAADEPAERVTAKPG